MVMRILKTNIPANPVRCRVRLPILSINGMVINVITSIMPPIPLVACAARSSEIPALVNNLNE